MTYFNELPEVEYLSFLPDRISSNDFIRVKNFFRRAKLREDIEIPLLVFEKYEIPDGYRPDDVAEELYENSSYDWIVLIVAGIINVRNEWPISNSDLYRYSFEKYEEQLNEVNHYTTIEQRDSKNRIIFDGGKNTSSIIQIPFPSYEGEIDFNTFFSSPNIGINSLSFSVDGNFYLHDISTIKTTTNYGTFSFIKDSNVGYGGTWNYQLDTNSLSNLVFDNELKVSDSIQYIAEDGHLKVFKIETTLDNSGPGITTTLSINLQSSETSYITFYDSSLNLYDTKTNILKAVSNYEYETTLNNEKRQINVLKSEYIQEFLRDIRNIMKYKKSSQLIVDDDNDDDDDIIKTENLRSSNIYGSNFYKK